ncbi:unnamed protein product [Anisakis simplex]|uniref:AMP-binding domain-containing protein n=1 Tax=Anisakis simplex TaxID=6269 RepID=A0A0M3JSV2_ANISI|nr:unnamed protein product [Anisakis simplex]
MEIQNPFQIVWQKLTSTNFTDFLLARFSQYGTNLAMVCQAVFAQMACSSIGSVAVSINGFLTVDDIWQQVDLSESTHAITEPQFLTKVEEVKRKAIMRGGSRIKVVALLEDILSDVKLRKEGFTSITKLRPSAMQQQLANSTISVNLSTISTGATNINTTSTISPQQSTLIDSSPTFENQQQQYSTPESPVVVILKSSILSSIAIFTYKLKDNTTRNEEDSDQSANDNQSRPAVTNLSKTSTNFLSPSLSSTPLSKQTIFLFFSSGTTGLNKAVEISNLSFIINIQQISCPIYGPPTAKERFLLVLSLHHIFGSLSAYYALANGATLYFLSRYTAKNFLDSIEQHKINLVHVTPPMVQMLAFDRLVDGRNLSSLRTIIVAGAPMDANTLATCKERLQIEDLRQAYGMTEMGGLCTLSHFGCNKLASVGIPLPGMLVKVVNYETKELCQPNQLGQLFVMGPQVLPTFYKNPKANNEIVDSLGYLKSGDAAYYDEDGYIYILDRLKDLIKYKTILVCPSEVESILRSHPGIDDCAVVGRQDHVSGEVPAAFVVKNAQYQLLSSAEVRQHVAGKIAQFKELRGGVFFVSDIPRSVCGKVLRRQLKQYWDRERTASRDNLLLGQGIGSGSGPSTPDSSISHKTMIRRTTTIANITTTPTKNINYNNTNNNKNTTDKNKSDTNKNVNQRERRSTSTKSSHNSSASRFNKQQHFSDTQRKS